MFTVKSRSNMNLVVCSVSEVDEALIAEASGFRVDGIGHESIVALAEARVEASPDYNALPGREDKYVRYTSKAGRMLICEVVRLTHPDEEGFPQLLEVINLQHPDRSFMIQASQAVPIDLSAMHPALANALLQGEQYEENGGGNTPKLTKGLRKKPE